MYNVERYIRECLDSIARLSAVSWEAILIDDGSTDESGEICDEYVNKDSRIKIYHKKMEALVLQEIWGLTMQKENGLLLLMQTII